MFILPVPCEEEEEKAFALERPWFHLQIKAQVLITSMHRSTYYISMGPRDAIVPLDCISYLLVDSLPGSVALASSIAVLNKPGACFTISIW